MINLILRINGIANPAINCRAIFGCPYRTKCPVPALCVGTRRQGNPVNPENQVNHGSDNGFARYEALPRNA